jgi:hypothetical protein
MIDEELFVIDVRYLLALHAFRGNRAAPTGPLEIALLSADATANSVM